MGKYTSSEGEWRTRRGRQRDHSKSVMCVRALMWTMEHRILMSSSAFLGGKKKQKPKGKKKESKKALRINSKPRSIYVTLTPLRHITRTNNTKKSHRDLFLTHCAGRRLQRQRESHENWNWVLNCRTVILKSLLLQPHYPAECFVGPLDEYIKQGGLRLEWPTSGTKPVPLCDITKGRLKSTSGLLPFFREFGNKTEGQITVRTLVKGILCEPRWAFIPECFAETHDAE